MEFGDTKDQKPIYINTKKYTSIQTVWAEYSQYKQTSAGLNHFRRDVIIADFDDSLENFNKAFQNSGLPAFSYILVNKDTGHVQAGYILETPFQWDLKNEKEKELYLTCKRNLNSFCPDNGYKGWRCKNPYFKEFHTVWNNIVYNKDFIIQILLNIYPINNNNVSKYVNKTERRKVLSRREKTAGRNNYYFYKTMIYYSDCKCGKVICSEAELLTWLLQNEEKFRKELLQENPKIKNEPLPEKELKTICVSAKKNVDKYFCAEKTGGRYSAIQRENSLIMRRALKEKKFIDFCDYMDYGIPFKDILEAIGIKKTTGYEFKNFYTYLINTGEYECFRLSTGNCIYSNREA